MKLTTRDGGRNVNLRNNNTPTIINGSNYPAWLFLGSLMSCWGPDLGTSGTDRIGVRTAFRVRDVLGLE